MGGESAKSKRVGRRGGSINVLLNFEFKSDIKIIRISYYIDSLSLINKLNNRFN